MADMKVAIRLRWKTGDDLRVESRLEIGCDNIPDEVTSCFRNCFNCRHDAQGSRALFAVSRREHFRPGLTRTMLSSPGLTRRSGKHRPWELIARSSRAMTPLGSAPR